MSNVSAMIAPPTDRLHKFIAIAGVALILIGVTYPIEKYNESELARINALEKMDETKFAQQRFAQKVKEEKAIMSRTFDSNGLKKPNVSVEQLRKAAQDFFEREPEARKLEKEMNDALIQYKKHSELTKHYESMKKLWFFIGALSFLIGTSLSIVGFRQWLSQPKSSR